MILIIDTNIYYSAIGFDNSIYDFVFSAFVNPNHQVFCSTPIFEELKQKLFSQRFDQKTKNKLTSIQKIEFLELLLENLIFVEPMSVVKICRDPKDNMFLELAHDINADFIVTGDKDLLTLQNYKTTRIVKPSEFVELNK
jgi:uncharacterized protein